MQWIEQYFIQDSLKLLARQALKETICLVLNSRKIRSQSKKYLGDIVKTHAIGKQTWHYRFDNKQETGIIAQFVYESFKFIRRHGCTPNRLGIGR